MAAGRVRVRRFLGPLLRRRARVGRHSGALDGVRGFAGAVGGGSCRGGRRSRAVRYLECCFRPGGVSRAGRWWKYRRWLAITVQRSQRTSERVGSRGGRLVVTDAARDAIRRVCRDGGRQALLLSWPGGAVCLPSSLYTPTAFDVIIGHIARCPIYVDLRQLGFCADARVVLDATQAWPQRPPLRLRPADRAEPARGPRAAPGPK